MIKLDCKTAKTYIVRFYPNISTVQYPVFNKTYYWHRNAIEPKNVSEISEKQYAYLININENVFTTYRYYSYAKVNGVFGLFEYNLSIYHYITDKANIEQINIFDLQGKYALKITGEIKNGFIHYAHCELLEDEQYIAYKPGDNQEVIIEFLKSQTEAIPERYLDNKYN